MSCWRSPRSSITTTARRVEHANLLNYELGEVLPGCESFDFLAGDNNHSNAKGSHLHAHQKIGRGKMFRFACDPVCSDQNAESNPSMPDFRQKQETCSLLAASRHPLHSTRKKSGLLLTLRDRSRFGKRHRSLQLQILRGVGRRIVNDGQASTDDRRVICGHRSEPVRGSLS